MTGRSEMEVRRLGGVSKERTTSGGSLACSFGDTEVPRVLVFEEPDLSVDDDRTLGDVFNLLRVVGEDLIDALFRVVDALCNCRDGVEGLGVGLKLIREGEDAPPLIMLFELLVDEAVLGLRGLGLPRRTLF